MTPLKTAVVGATLASALATAVYEARQVSVLRGQIQQLQLHHSQSIVEIQRLKRESVEATRQLAGSSDENDRLKRNSREVLALRGEVTRLRKDLREFDTLKANSIGTGEVVESEPKEALAKVDRLKQLLDQSPATKIPEIQLLTPTDWIKVAKNINLMYEASDPPNLYQVRAAGKQKLATTIAKGLHAYAQANANQLPPNLSELRPFFEPTVSDEILNRYKLLHTGRLADLPSGSYLVEETAVVDQRMDTLFSIGLDKYNFKYTSSNGEPGEAREGFTVYIKDLTAAK